MEKNDKKNIYIHIPDMNKYNTNLKLLAYIYKDILITSCISKISEKQLDIIKITYNEVLKHIIETSIVSDI